MGGFGGPEGPGVWVLVLVWSGVVYLSRSGVRHLPQLPSCLTTVSTPLQLLYPHDDTYSVSIAPQWAQHCSTRRHIAEAEAEAEAEGWPDPDKVLSLYRPNTEQWVLVRGDNCYDMCWSSTLS